MGIENMRRWPMYIVFAVCIMLLLSLFNSWSLETELRNKIAEITTQLQECSKQQSSCMEESLSLLEQRDSYVVKVNNLDKQKVRLSGDLEVYKNKVSKYESKVNHTLVDVDLCKTELQSLKNLKASQSATLETLRLEKDTLTTQLTDRKQKIEDLEKEIEILKLSLKAKSAPIVRVTPEAPVQKINPVLNPPVGNEPMLENAAKEEMEDSNAINDGNEFDPPGSVRIGSEGLDLVEDTIFLGITIYSKLQWGPHITNLTRRLNSAAFAVRQIRYLTDVETARLVYFSYFHSIMSYGILLWGRAADINTIFVMYQLVARELLREK